MAVSPTSRSAEKFCVLGGLERVKDGTSIMVRDKAFLALHIATKDGLVVFNGLCRVDL